MVLYRKTKVFLNGGLPVDLAGRGRPVQCSLVGLQLCVVHTRRAPTVSQVQGKATSSIISESRHIGLWLHGHPVEGPLAVNHSH